MERHLTVKNCTVSFTLRKSKRAKRMRLSVHGGGEVRVTAPFRLKEKIAEDFVRENIEWLLSRIAQFKHYKKLPARKLGRAGYKKHKEEARRLIQERVRHWSAVYNCNFNRISIRNQKTRWGSCSKKGNLNFSFKLLFLPERVRDYVVVHELCHLKEFNHSKEFWSLVAQTFPDYKKLRAELQKYSLRS